MRHAPYGDFRLRTVAFSRRILAFCSSSQAMAHGPHVRDQVRKAGTAIAANVEEAKAAQSKRDFLAKMSIALGEARETLYWLRLFCSAHPAGTPSVGEQTIPSDTSDGPDGNGPQAKSDVRAMVDEADQLVAILTATVRTTRANLKAEAEARARTRQRH